MAKKSAIEKNHRRRRMADRYATRRAELRAIVHDRARAPEERFEATLMLAELPRNSAKVRVRNRCALTGRICWTHQARQSRRPHTGRGELQLDRCHGSIAQLAPEGQRGVKTNAGRFRRNARQGNHHVLPNASPFGAHVRGAKTARLSQSPSLPRLVVRVGKFARHAYRINGDRSSLSRVPLDIGAAVVVSP